MELEATIVQSADPGAKTSKGNGALLPRQGVSTHLQQQKYKDSLTFFKQFSRYARFCAPLEDAVDDDEPESQ